MKEKEMLLIRPKTDNIGLSATPVGRMPSLNLRVIKELTENSNPNYNVTIVDELKGQHAEKYLDSKVNLIGITAMTAMATRGYEISEMFRKREVTTILGGIHATVLPEEARQYADTVVTGEVEPLWSQILSDFENGELRSRYDCGHLADMTLVPKLKKEKGDILSYTTQTARGCPIGCDFCSVTSVYGKTVRKRPIEDVISEITNAREKGARFIAFADDNILAPGKENRERALELFKEIYYSGLNVVWGAQTSTNFGNDPEALYWAEKSGCKTVFLGIESLSSSTLKERKKSFNLKQMDEENSFSEPIKRIKSHGISVVGGFIFGNDADGEEVFDNTREFILNTQLDGAEYSILTPLPGTKLFSDYKAQGRLLYTDFPKDWAKYDVNTPVIKPLNMTVEKLAEEVNKLYKETHSLIPSAKRAISTLATTHHPLITIAMFMTNLAYRRHWNDFKEDQSPCIKE